MTITINAQKYKLIFFIFSKLYNSGLIVVFLLISNLSTSSSNLILQQTHCKFLNQKKVNVLFNKSSSLFSNKSDLNYSKTENIYFIPNQKDTIIYYKLPKNSIYLELLGFGFFYSVNYERTLFENKNNFITGRIGFSSFPMNYPYTVVIIPVVINYQTIVNRTISFEIGCGYRFIDRSIMANAGFRFLIKNKFLIKVNFTPQLYGFKGGKWDIVYMGKGFGIIPFGGISFGYSFGK